MHPAGLTEFEVTRDAKRSHDERMIFPDVVNRYSVCVYIATIGTATP